MKLSESFCRSPDSGVPLSDSTCSIEQDIFQRAVEVRRLVVFEHRLAVWILEQYDAERRIEGSAEIMTCHHGGGEGIADIVLDGIARAAGDLQQRAVVALEENRELWAAGFIFAGAFPVAPRRIEAMLGSSFGRRDSSAARTSAKGRSEAIVMCSTGIVFELRWVLVIFGPVRLV